MCKLTRIGCQRCKTQRDDWNLPINGQIFIYYLVTVLC